jgi:hypothetical protein
MGDPFMYVCDHYENDEQTLHVPTGKEMRYGVFGQ